MVFDATVTALIRKVIITPPDIMCRWGFFLMLFQKNQYFVDIYTYFATIGSKLRGALFISDVE